MDYRPVIYFMIYLINYGACWNNVGAGGNPPTPPAAILEDKSHGVSKELVET